MSQCQSVAKSIIVLEHTLSHSSDYTRALHLCTATAEIH